MRAISKIAFFLFMTGIAILPKEISAQQTEQKETKAQERERKLVESRKEHADQFRGKYTPNKYADDYVGKWETANKSVQLEITKRITEFNHLEFHFFMDVLDVHFTKFEAAGKNIIGLIGDEFEFGYSGPEGWKVYVDDPFTGGRMRFVFSRFPENEAPNDLVLFYKTIPWGSAKKHDTSPMNIPRIDLVRIK